MRNKKVTPSSFIRESLRGSRTAFAFAFSAIIIATVLGLLDPIVIRYAIDTVIGGKPADFPGWLSFAAPFADRYLGSALSCAIALVAITAVQGIFLFLKGYLSATASERTALKIRTSLFGHLSTLPFLYFSNANSGDLIQRCTSDVDTVRKFLGSQIIDVGRALSILVLATAFMFSLDARMALASSVAIPLIFAFSYVFFRKVQKAFKLSDEAEGKLSAVIQENLHGLRVVRAFSAEGREIARFDERNREYTGVTTKLIDLLAWYWGISSAICLIQIGCSLAYGAYLASAGQITLGTMVLFYAYTGRVLWPVRQMGRTLTEFGKATVSLRRLAEIMAEESEFALEDGTPEGSPSGNDGRDVRGEIEFRRVTFGYDPAKPVIKDLSFVLKAGETGAILGKTGSGKSTVLHLLARLVEPDSGEILLDGIDIADWDLRELRNRVGIVLQEPFLFSRSLGDNVKLGKPDGSELEIESAAMTAGLTQVVEGFEKGWETMVGEEGVTLSGGQRQRAAIARTLLKDPPVLVFDDSLSAVDTETDSKIRRELKDKRGDRTTLLVSHRITTLSEADRIFVLEDGKLAEEGTHEELVGREGLYSRIWGIQSAGSEDDGDGTGPATENVALVAGK